MMCLRNHHHHVIWWTTCGCVVNEQTQNTFCPHHYRSLITITAFIIYSWKEKNLDWCEREREIDMNHAAWFAFLGSVRRRKREILSSSFLFFFLSFLYECFQMQIENGSLSLSLFYFVKDQSICADFDHQWWIQQ